MRYYTLILFSIVISLLSCSNSKNKETQGQSSQLKDTIIDKNNIPENSISSNLTPTLLSIEGDWDGDGKKEKLTECYFSRKLNKMVTSPFFSQDSIDYMDCVGEAIKLDAMSFLVSENNKIDTLFISTSRNAQTFGVLFLQNEGDMDGDTLDEIGYVENIAQMSTLTMYHIMSYKNGKWIELFSFPTWSWVDLGSIVEKIGDKKYKIKYRGRESMEEEMILNLNKNPQPESIPFFVKDTIE